VYQFKSAYKINNFRHIREDPFKRGKRLVEMLHENLFNLSCTVSLTVK